LDYVILGTIYLVLSQLAELNGHKSVSLLCSLIGLASCLYSLFAPKKK